MLLKQQQKIHKKRVRFYPYTNVNEQTNFVNKGIKKKSNTAKGNMHIFSAIWLNKTYIVFHS